MDFISSQIKHELMTLLITEEARYDKDQSIRHTFVSICRRKPTKCRAVHRAPEAIMLQKIVKTAVAHKLFVHSMQNMFFFHGGCHFNFLNLVGLGVTADPKMLGGLGDNPFWNFRRQGGLIYGSNPWYGMDIFWNCPLGRGYSEKCLGCFVLVVCLEKHSLSSL